MNKNKKPLKTYKAEEEINCLVTGFDPFFERPFNPSEAIAQSMPSQIRLPGSKTKVVVKHLILPTINRKCWQVLEPSLKKMRANKRACSLILLGLATSNKTITMERFALNIHDYSIPDNNNQLITNERIIELAPEALRTTAPIEKYLARLKKQGYPAEISNKSGTFICNEIYFRALYYFQRHFKKSRSPYSVILVHLPLPKSYGKTLKEKGNKKMLPFAKSNNKQMIAMSKVIKSIVELNCEFLVKQMQKSR